MQIGRVLLDLFESIVPAPLPAWQSVAGPLARHVRVTAFDEATGTLTLAVDSKAWLTQTRLLAGALIRALNAELGSEAVRRIHVVKTTPSEPLPELPVFPVTPYSLPEVAARPADPAVRAALRRQAEQLPREPAQLRSAE